MIRYATFPDGTPVTLKTLREAVQQIEEAALERNLAAEIADNVQPKFAL